MGHERRSSKKIAADLRYIPTFAQFLPHEPSTEFQRIYPF